MFSLRLVCCASLAAAASGINIRGSGKDRVDPSLPGAPSNQSFKDGFMYTECINDQVLTGSSVEPVRYSDHVGKLEQLKMTPRVCFEFCRTVQTAGFFGIRNGGDCYCAPYFHAQPKKGEDQGLSACTEPCEGDSSLKCGDKTKSSIFSMHNCADVVSRVQAELAVYNGLISDLKVFAVGRHELLENTHMWANSWKIMAHLVNDPTFDSMRHFEERIAELLELSNVVKNIMTHKCFPAMDPREPDVCYTAPLESTGSGSAEDVRKVEASLSNLENVNRQVQANAVRYQKLWKELYPSYGQLPPPARNGTQDPYELVMNHVDKSRALLPATCMPSDMNKAKVVIANGEEDCKAQCVPPNCVAVQYYIWTNGPVDQSTLCMTMEDVAHVTTYDMYASCKDKVPLEGELLLTAPNCKLAFTPSIAKNILAGKGRECHGDLCVQEEHYHKTCVDEAIFDEATKGVQ